MVVVDDVTRSFTNSSIGSFAEAVSSKFSIWEGEGPADVLKLVTELGGSVTYARSSEALHVEEPGRFFIFLPRFTSAARDRFTIAHELGHYLLHYILPKESGAKTFGRGERNRTETEANVFASALLMPKDAFREVWEKLDGDEWAVARHFEVSPAAAEVRAQVLNLT